FLSITLFILFILSFSVYFIFFFFFFNDTATTEIYTLSLHDALPISYNGDPNNNPVSSECGAEPFTVSRFTPNISTTPSGAVPARSEEHTSELQSRSDLVCRLLLEKKKKKKKKKNK